MHLRTTEEINGIRFWARMSPSAAASLWVIVKFQILGIRNELLAIKKCLYNMQSLATTNHQKAA